MLSTLLLYAAGGYFGTPASSSQFSSWASKIQFDDDGWGPNPGPDDGPLPKIRLPRFPKIKWPPPPPPDWSRTVAGLVGGIVGGYAVNAGVSSDVALGVAGAVFSGRILSDVVNVAFNNSAKTL
jgi:hypothetical protein